VEIACGDIAAGRLQPWSAAVARPFELPLRFGCAIASWNRPEFVPADEADHVRDDDYVVGLVHRGVARAYPLWIADYYHVINDRIADDPIIFTTCERCQSGAAFVSRLDGQAARFDGVGLQNASLMLRDTAGLRTSPVSLWQHYEGVAVAGDRAGTFLQQIPTFHGTWREWRLAHPDTAVLVEPVDPQQRDQRHGHGREEYFSRPGIEPGMVQTIAGSLDDVYPEHEMVLGINVDAGIKAYPWREVKKNGGIVHDQLGPHSVVVFAGPRPDQVTMAAYDRRAAELVLHFGLADAAFVDRETRSRWTIEGLAIEGPLAGTWLTPVRSHHVHWHAWFYWHRTTELYLRPGDLPAYPNLLASVDTAPFAPLLEALASTDRQVIVETAVPNLRLPHEALGGLVLRAERDRLNLFLFATAEAAADYVALESAWSSPLFDARLERKRAARSGTFVLESDPDVQYADAAQIVRLPDAQIEWSELVTDDGLVRTWGAATGSVPGGGATTGVAGLVRRLREGGYDIVEVAFVPRCQLRVGVASAVAATINGDRFLIYKCVDEAAARAVRQSFTAAVQVDRWVLRSTPVDLFEDPRYEIRQRADHEVHWSALVRDARLVDTIRKHVVGLE
jgi:hypothetical protein